METKNEAKKRVKEAQKERLKKEKEQARLAKEQAEKAAKEQADVVRRPHENVTDVPQLTRVPPPGFLRRQVRQTAARSVHRAHRCGFPPLAALQNIADGMMLTTRRPTCQIRRHLGRQ